MEIGAAGDEQTVAFGQVAELLGVPLLVRRVVHFDAVQAEPGQHMRMLRQRAGAPDGAEAQRLGGLWPTLTGLFIGGAVFVLADEYLERVRNMYYRSRNHTCIIGFALGGESGNGYNMYKAYQWLKSVEPSRPVICIDAGGEWDTDLEIVP